MFQKTILKAAALTCSVLLAAGFVYYRSTGTFPWAAESSAQASNPQSAAPTKSLMPSSKSLVVTPQASKAPATTPATAPRILISGSKSGVIISPTPPATQPTRPSSK